MPVGVKLTDATFRKYLAAEKQTIRAFAKQSGIDYSVLSRLGRDRMPTDKQKLQISICTGGRVQPNDWYADLPMTVQRLEITEDQLARLMRGETVVPARTRRRRVELILRKVVPVAAAALICAATWIYKPSHTARDPEHRTHWAGLASQHRSA